MHNVAIGWTRSLDALMHINEGSGLGSARPGKIQQLVYPLSRLASTNYGKCSDDYVVRFLFCGLRSICIQQSRKSACGEHDFRPSVTATRQLSQNIKAFVPLTAPIPPHPFLVNSHTFSISWPIHSQNIFLSRKPCHREGINASVIDLERKCVFISAKSTLTLTARYLTFQLSVHSFVRHGTMASLFSLLRYGLGVYHSV